MINGTTRNIEHDIPHQIYMAQYVLGKTKNTKLLLLDEKPMIKENKKIERHGYSKVICMKDDVLVILHLIQQLENLWRYVKKML